MEAHCFDPADPYRRPSWDEITDVIEQLPPLPGGSAVTVEPGGAVELSGPPEDGVVAAIGAMNNDQAVLRTAFAEAGLGLVFLGADPLRPPKRVNPGARYRAMEQFFAASHSDEAGAAMMTSTASIQVNVDAGPQAGWAARVRLAHALGPTMIAIAANSPMLGGEFTGWVSTRQRVWGQMDSARCGPILGASGDDPGTDWARYALKAPVMMVHNPEAVARHPLGAVRRLGRRPALLGDRRPTLADLDYHLTTLFPPVRPRQWLEIRYLDSAPDDVWPAMVFTLVDPARRPGRRRRRGRGRRAGGHRMGHRGPARSARPAAARGRQPLRGDRGREGAGGAHRRDAAAGPQRRAGPMSRRRLLRPGDRARHRGHGVASWRKGACDSAGTDLADDLDAGADAHAAAGRFR